MPHLVVKIYAGRSDAEKQALADRLSGVVQDVLGYGPEAVSIGIEDVSPARWTQDVYRPDIEAKVNTLFKRPGYGSLA